MIEGYSTSTIPFSVAPGEAIRFHVHSDTPYKVQYVRLHNPGDQFSVDPMGDPFDQQTHIQARPNSSPWEGYDWESDFSVVVPSEWSSGFYAAYCQATEGSDYYIPFVVKPANDHGARYKRFAMLASILTWNAYNDRDDRYQYDGLNEELTLSFHRPFPLLRPCKPYYENDGKATRHTLRADLWITGWLASRNYQIDLYTDLDLHAATFQPTDYAGLILGTHPEYWTMAMRDRLDAHLDAGGTLVYLGGNGVYEKVEVRNGLSEIRVSGCGTGAAGPRWLFRHEGRSERSALGVAYQEYGGPGTGYRTRAADHRFFSGTAVQGKFDVLFGEDGFSGTAGDGNDGHACGWEMDSASITDDAGAAPACTTVLATSAGEPGTTADMVVVEDCHRGCLVYSVGSICYSGSLGKGDDVLDGVLRNVLGEALMIAMLRHDRQSLHWLLQIVAIWPPELVRPGPPEGPDWDALKKALRLPLFVSKPAALATALGRAVALASKDAIAADPHRVRIG